MFICCVIVRKWICKSNGEIYIRMNQLLIKFLKYYISKILLPDMFSIQMNYFLSTTSNIILHGIKFVMCARSINGCIALISEFLNV